MREYNTELPVNILSVLRFSNEAHRMEHIPASNELIFEQSTNRVYLGDGMTAGGILLDLHDTFVALPDQQAKSGAYLCTDGTTLAWEKRNYYTFTPFITENYQAKNLDYIRSDSSAGAFTITLPQSPADYDRIIIHDVSGTNGKHPVTVSSAHIFAGHSTVMELRPFSLVEFTFYQGQWAVNQGGSGTALEADYHYVKTWVFPIATEVTQYVMTDGQLPSADHEDYALYLDGKESLNFLIDKTANTVLLQDMPVTDGTAQLKFWCTRPAKEISTDSDVSVGENFYFTQLPKSQAQWKACDKNSQLTLLDKKPFGFSTVNTVYTLKTLVNGKLLLWAHHNEVATSNHSKSTFYLGTLNATTNSVTWTVAGTHPTDKCRGTIAEFGNGQLIMGGGFTGTTSTNSVPHLYLGTFSGNRINWIPLADSAAGNFHDVSNGSCTLHDGRVFDLYGGYGVSGANYSHYTSRIFSVAQNAVSVIEQETPFPCSGMSAVQLPDKRLLVTGTVPYYVVSGGANKTLCYFGTINADSSITWQEGKGGIQAIFPPLLQTFDRKLLVLQNYSPFANEHPTDKYSIGTVHGTNISWVQNQLPIQIDTAGVTLLDDKIVCVGCTEKPLAVDTCIFGYYAAMTKIAPEQN